MNLGAVSVNPSTPAAEEPGLDIAGDTVVALRLDGRIRTTPPPSGWPYSDLALDNTRAAADDAVIPAAARSLKLRATPYYAWGNRGATSMRVWVPRHS